MSDRNDWSNLSRLTPLDEVKFVLADRSDYDWAKKIISSHDLFTKAGHILLSPVYRELDPSDLVAWMIQDRLDARLNLQLHKVVWSPTARGV
jgi:7-carboxy-7-deazaguanine synthase